MAKILIVAGLGSSLLRFRGDLIKEWLRLGHNVVAAAPESNVEDALNKMGVTYYSIPLKRTGLNPLEDLLLLVSLFGLLLKSKPDLLFLYTIKPVIYASIVSYCFPSLKVATMITGLGYVFTEGKRIQKLKIFVRWLYRIALKKSMIIFFQNADDRDDFVNMKIVDSGKVKLVNGSGVNLKHFYPIAIPGPPLKFLMVARLLFHKGIVEYAEAAKMIKEKYPKVTFTLIGSFNPNPASIKKDLLDKWVAEEIINYLGWVDDVRPHIEKAHVYVLPSYREGIPRSTLEAMAMGRPVITTDAPGCRETVVDGINGYLVPAMDSHSLALAMEKYILEPQKVNLMGSKSRMIVEEKYDVRIVNQQINSGLDLIEAADDDSLFSSK